MIMHLIRVENVTLKQAIDMDLITCRKGAFVTS